MRIFFVSRLIHIATLTCLSALQFSPVAASNVAPQPVAARAENTNPELTLTLSLELSTEPGNETAVVGKLVRTHLLIQDDQIELTQRYGNLRKEFLGKYVRPTNVLGFGIVSHELRLADIQQFITSEKTLRSSQGSYRNLFGRQTGLGLVGVGWGAEALRLDSEAGLAPYLFAYIAREGRTSHIVPLLAYWAYDRRKADTTLPTGHYDSVAAEWGGFLGNTRYAKLDVSHESFWTISPRVSAGFGFSLGYLKGLDGHLSPITKRYFGGGAGSVRGYESGSLGPSDVSGANMGADRKVSGTAEVLWHAFDIGQTPVVLSAFVDRGRFYGAENSAVPSVVAGATGLGISIPAPFGLARFSFARPSDETQRTQRFQFDARASWR
ncbi:MAG: BamA/TamA family outer membrane protein [Burkholderiales bacterium]|nr:BamA/TamA family outer membrane protein [Burkholderiales bacterium]